MNNPSRTELIQQFLEASGHIYRLMLPVKTQFMTDLALNRSQFEVMMYIMRSNNPTIKDIARSFNITSSAATQLVAGLVHKKLVERKESSLDRRIVNVILSKEGEGKCKMLKKLVFAEMTEKLASLSDHELLVMKNIADKISTAWEEK
jgi:DNA-binding MarR family transcriptional regulator